LDEIGNRTNIACQTLSTIFVFVVP